MVVGFIRGRSIHSGGAYIRMVKSIRGAFMVRQVLSESFGSFGHQGIFGFFRGRLAHSGLLRSFGGRLEDVGFIRGRSVHLRAN